MIREGLRYGVVGIASTLLHTAIALSCNYFAGFNAVQSNISGFSVAIIFSFLLNTTWSFEKKINQVFFIRFIAVNGVTLALLLIISLLSDRIHLDPMHGILAVAIVIPVVGFLSHKYWTYAD